MFTPKIKFSSLGSFNALEESEAELRGVEKDYLLSLGSQCLPALGVYWHRPALC